MDRTWKPTAAGILCIIAGIVGVIPGIAFAASFAWGAGMFGAPSIVLGIIAIVGGIYALRRRRWGLALAGSICALFGAAGLLAIFGLLIFMFADMVPGLQLPWIFDNICTDWYFMGWSFGSVIFGILAITFVIRGKHEFK